MQYIGRAIEESFLKKVRPGKVTLLLGARRIGKTSFIQHIVKKMKEPMLMLNGEDMDTIQMLSHRSIENYKRVAGKNKLIIIDEAQKIPEVGQVLKLMIDELPDLKIIATGSSMFDLGNKLGEPLTGRNITFLMFPFAQMELSKEETIIQIKGRLEERLIYGSYPELWQYQGMNEKAAYLKELINAYLFKDIIAYEGIRNSSKMIDLLRLVAFQIGNDVSIQEIAKQLGISRATVDKYLDLLTKVFILHKVSAYSKNLRSEISKSNRWYFYDNGVRNALISNFNSLNLRDDVGALWENYVISERLKFQNYTGMISNNYFWRTYQQQEVDWVEERAGNLFAYEMKWGTKKKVGAPSAWKKAYPKSEFMLVNPDNYLDWIGG